MKENTWRNHTAISNHNANKIKTGLDDSSCKKKKKNEYSAHFGKEKNSILRNLFLRRALKRNLQDYTAKNGPNLQKLIPQLFIRY